MGTFFFYNNRKPRQYKYKPILYDPDEEERKEKLNRRIHEIKKEMNALTPEEDTNKAEEIRGEFLAQTKHLKRRKEREEAGKSSFLTNNGLLIVILLFLLAILFFWILS
ncbi:hypothetical protein [Anaerorudis cellulosivorans]|uniref:hypothetical protein n=1 Tax=Anaerorudis cellulosivorans TaxID=3397862 RepID=UPI00222070E1|nr:hypothetical protein [Seramator thermalis]MCW1734612.1 hypothetical protein [Seramator thermalis]